VRTFNYSVKLAVGTHTLFAQAEDNLWAVEQTARAVANGAVGTRALLGEMNGRLPHPAIR